MTGIQTALTLLRQEYTEIVIRWSRKRLEKEGRTAIGIALLPLLAPGAWSRPMHMMESLPAAQAIVDGNKLQYVVRSDGLALTPLLNSAPTVLFASSSRLPRGNYQLHWSARSMPDADPTDGSFDSPLCNRAVLLSFTVSDGT